MISLYVTCLWLQRNGVDQGGANAIVVKPMKNGVEIKVAQMIASHLMRGTSGEQEVCVVSLSLRMYKTINASPVAFGDGLVVASLSAQQQIVAQLCLRRVRL